MTTKTKKPKMNIALLRKVQKEILARPDQFNMDGWFKQSASNGFRAGGCGTAGCIGGWGLALTLRPKTKRLDRLNPVQNIETFRDLFGLTLEQAERLFYEDEWPLEFKWFELYRPDNLTAARLASKRIDHFIKTKGEE